MLLEANKVCRENGIPSHTLMEDTIDTIVGASEGWVFHPGDVVIADGIDEEKGNELYFLVSGQLHVFDGTNGTGVGVTLYEGMFFGWHAILKEHPTKQTIRQGTVTVPENGKAVVVAVIDVSKLQEILYDMRGISRFHEQRMESDARFLREQLAEKLKAEGDNYILSIEDSDEFEDVEEPDKYG